MGFSDWERIKADDADTGDLLAERFTVPARRVQSVGPDALDGTRILFEDGTDLSCDPQAILWRRREPSLADVPPLDPELERP
jgi:hypothetical protein